MTTYGCKARAMAPSEDGERALVAAEEAFARFDINDLVAQLSAAIRSFTTAGEPRRAAMACIRLGEVYANFMGNLTAARAWFARARRLVESEPPCIEQGWAAIAAMGCDVDDPAVLLAGAQFALERARQFGDLNLETKALADAGLAHVQAGRLVDGMTLLDEAMALACGPADDSETAAKSVCSFFTACYFAADFERAASWADALRSHGLIGLTPGGPIFLSNHCDSVRATLLVELGRWSEAEAILTRAKAEFEDLMFGPSWHPDIALADLRVRQGRLAEAEALLLGKDQAMQALLPAAHLHQARGDHDLARATAQRGLKALGDDRLRTIELLTVLVDVEVASGNLDAAAASCARLRDLVGDVAVESLRVRSAATCARLMIATGDSAGAIATLEATALHADRLPFARARLLIELARAREPVDRVAAAIDARMASAALDTLDVIVDAADTELLERLCPTRTASTVAPVVCLRRDGNWWVVSHESERVRLQNTKGLQYLAELIARPGVEQHVLDLVDRIEGVAPAGGVDRRQLGGAGPAIDSQARLAYRHRIEELRAQADDALAADMIGTVERCQAEIDELVSQLSAAFGLGGRDRPTASAAERARLNVTRAMRAAIVRLVEVVPGPGAVLDRRLRTGTFCAYDGDDDDEFRWKVVQS